MLKINSIAANTLLPSRRRGYEEFCQGSDEECLTQESRREEGEK